MQKSTYITLSVLLVIVILAAIALYIVLQNNAQQALLESEAGGALANSTSTNFTNLAGDTVDLEQFIGQTLVVNSWASWSPASVTELQLLTQIADQFDAQDVEVIAINRAESRTTAEAFLKAYNLQDQVFLVIDTDDRYYQAIGGYAMPETVIYDSRGEVVQHIRGAINERQLTTTLDQLIESEN